LDDPLAQGYPWGVDAGIQGVQKEVVKTLTAPPFKGGS
jgi:hypothetical protein